MFDILILNKNGEITTGRAEEQLKASDKDIEGRKLSSLIKNQENLAEELIKEARTNNRAEAEKVTVACSEKDLETDLTVTSVEGRNDDIIGYIAILSANNPEKAAEDMENLISHEIKNLIFVAQGFLDLAQKSNNDEDLEKVEETHQKIMKVIEDVEKTQRGEIEKEKVSLQKVFEDAYSYSSAESTSYTVEDAELHAGRVSLMRLFANLISNSVRHNTEDVEIGAGPLEDKTGFYYEDDGAGLIEEQIKKIFDQDFTTSEKGNGGLGMFMVKEIADLHNWKINISKSSNGGARFEFREK